MSWKKIKRVSEKSRLLHFEGNAHLIRSTGKTPCEFQKVHTSAIFIGCSVQCPRDSPSKSHQGEYPSYCSDLGGCWLWCTPTEPVRTQRTSQCRVRLDLEGGRLTFVTPGRLKTCFPQTADISGDKRWGLLNPVLLVFLFFFTLSSVPESSSSLTLLLLFFFLGFALFEEVPPFLVDLPPTNPFISCCNRRAISSSVSSLSRFAAFLGFARGTTGDEAGSGDSSFLILLNLGNLGFEGGGAGSESWISF